MDQWPTGDFGVVIERINARFGTRFARFEPSDENNKRCFGWIDQSNRHWHSDAEESNRTAPRPTADHEAKKQRLSTALDDPALTATRAAAHGLYQRFSAMTQMATTRHVEMRTRSDPRGHRASGEFD